MSEYMNGYKKVGENTIAWIDPKTNLEHQISEEGHLFRWKARSVNSQQEQSYDFGNVPGGVYIAVKDILDSLAGVD